MNLVDSNIFLNAYGSLEKVIYHLKKDLKTKIGSSKIHGVGVFAIKDIKKGEEVFPIWKYETGIYLIPNDRLNEIPTEVSELLDMYFINEECGYKVIKLFQGFNFTFHGFSYCNSAYQTEYTQNISNDGIALRDIKAGEEILEWYHKNIN
jgi:SET domain-containing protein